MSKRKRMLLPVGFGLLGALFLTGVYFGIVSWAESPGHALDLFWQDRWIVIPLILGFGVQVALFTRLKQVVKGAHGGVVAVSGTTSTFAMVSCCSHYLVNILPLLGTVGILTVISQYQIELFWVGLIANFLGILYLTNKLRKIPK